jgi:hypothetical protein
MNAKIEVCARPSPTDGDAAIACPVQMACQLVAG